MRAAGRRLGVALCLAASALPACNSCGNTDYLHFDSQPTNTQAGAVITPPVVVSVRAPNTNQVDAISGTVTFTLMNGTTGAALGGTTRVDLDAGIAIFSDLSVDLAGPQYILQATSPGVDTAESSAFNVEGGPSDGGPCVNRCRVTLSSATNADFGFGVDGGSGFCFAGYGQPGALTSDGTLFMLTGGDQPGNVIAFSATLNIAGTPPSVGNAACTPSVSGSHPCSIFVELDGGILYSANGDDGGIGIQISAVSQYQAGTTDGGSHPLWCIDSQITAVATSPSAPSNPLQVHAGVSIH
jgi:hypothetical protein